MPAGIILVYVKTKDQALRFQWKWRHCCEVLQECLCAHKLFCSSCLTWPGHMWLSALNNLLYICTPRNQKTGVQTISNHWEAQRHGRTLWSVKLLVFWYCQGPWALLSLATLCLRMPCLEKGDLTEFSFHLRIIYLFFVLDTTLKVLRNSKTQHLARTVRYQLLLITPQPSPLITYYVSWDLLQSNNSGALHLHSPFLQGVQSAL